MHCKENIELSQIPLYIRHGKELAGQNDLKKIGGGGGTRKWKPDLIGFRIHPSTWILGSW